jgi:hypothetical protein
MSIDYILTFTLAAILAIKYVAFDRDTSEPASAPDMPVTEDEDSHLTPVGSDSCKPTENVSVIDSSVSQFTQNIPKVLIEPPDEDSADTQSPEPGKLIP